MAKEKFSSEEIQAISNAAEKTVEKVDNVAVAIAQDFLDAAKAKAKREKDGVEQIFELGQYKKKFIDNDGNEIERSLPLHRNCSRDEKVVLLEMLVGKASVDRLASLALSRNVHIMDMLEPGIDNAFNMGEFEGDNGEGRSGADEDDELIDNLRIREILGMGLFRRLKDHGRAKRCSNLDALCSGIKNALDRGAI